MRKHRRNPVRPREDRGPLYRGVSPWEMQAILDQGYVYGAGGSDWREDCQTFFAERLQDAIHHGAAYYRYFIWHHPLFQEGWEVQERAHKLATKLKDADDWHLSKIGLEADRLAYAITRRLQGAAFAAAGTAGNRARPMEVDAYVVELDGVEGGTRFTGMDNVGGAGESEVCFPPGRQLPLERARLHLLKEGQVVRSLDPVAAGWKRIQVPQVSLRRLQQARDYALRQIPKIERLEQKAGIVRRNPPASLPPLDVQREIASQLDHVTGQADDMLAKARGAAALAKELRFAHLARVFGSPREVHARLNPVQGLDGLIELTAGRPGADFYVQRSGTPDNVGRPFYKAFPRSRGGQLKGPGDPRHHIGVTVLRPDVLDPRFLFYVAEYAWRSKIYTRLCRGTLQLQHLNLKDVACGLKTVLGEARRVRRNPRWPDLDLDDFAGWPADAIEDALIHLFRARGEILSGNAIHAEKNLYYAVKLLDWSENMRGRWERGEFELEPPEAPPSGPGDPPWEPPPPVDRRALAVLDVAMKAAGAGDLGRANELVGVSASMLTPAASMVSPNAAKLAGQITSGFDPREIMRQVEKLKRDLRISRNPPLGADWLTPQLEALLHELERCAIKSRTRLYGAKEGLLVCEDVPWQTVDLIQDHAGMGADLEFGIVLYPGHEPTAGWPHTDPRELTGSYGHWWIRLEDGTIVDTAASQFGQRSPLVIPPGHPLQARYVPEDPDLPELEEGVYPLRLPRRR